MDMDKLPFLFRTDSYKLSHAPQYPAGTEYVYSYLESRGGMFDSTVFYGLNYYLNTLTESVDCLESDIRFMDKFANAHFGYKIFNREGWEYILKSYKGKLPLEIKAVPEGTRLPTKNVLMTIINTDPKCFWLTNFVESLLLKVWYTTTVATLSYEIKQVILKFLVKTGSPEDIDFKLQDFGYRGSSSDESAMLGGSAHLLNFLGSDNLSAIWFAQRYGTYNGSMFGYGIPASEHSTITSWGQEHELDAYKNFLDIYPKDAVIACVSDSYDIYNACEKLWGTLLRDQINERTGTLIVRPDSGDPESVVLKCLDILGEKFGTTVNSKGYKVLSPRIRLIQGDGVNYHSINGILTAMESRGWSADNIGFGMGGALLQGVNRDTQKFAIKCSAICVNGVWRNVHKNPITDPGKRSHEGKLALVERHGEYKTIQESEMVYPDTNLLKQVFLNGIVRSNDDFATIKDRLTNGCLNYTTV
jgi:nicotinamide phosphoribosyltransferase